MKVALVHDWLTGMRGGEKVLEIFCQLFPEATLFTLLHRPGSVSSIIEKMPIKTSFVQRFPFSQKIYPKYLLFFPTAIEQFDLNEFDLVISSSHCVAKGVVTPPETCHICYCLSPMRYAWEMYHSYFFNNHSGILNKTLIPFFMNYLRSWDERSSQRVDYFVAISNYIKNRIEKHYRRSSDVIYPPVNTDFFQLSHKSEDYFLVVSALVPYKRIDLAISAFNVLKFPLVIIGEGPEENNLKKMAARNIIFLPWQSKEKLKEYYSNCQALIFPGEEDFGIVPVEAQACGKPVIAYAKGGAKETVEGILVSEETQKLPKSAGQKLSGLFFYPQTKEALLEAVKSFQKMEFEPTFIRKNSLKFDQKLFKEKISKYISEKLKEHQKNFSYR